jgi:hypothetical protein
LNDPQHKLKISRLSIATMQIIAVLFASLATLAAANPLPLNPDSNKALVARADIVSVKCPTVNNAAEATYSVKEIEDAYNIAVGLLQPPPHYATGKPSMCLDTS